MSVNLSTESIARASSRRPLVTVGIWVLVFVIAVFLRANLFEDAITNEFVMTNNPESQIANDLIEEKLTGTRGTNEVVIVQSQGSVVDDPEFQKRFTLADHDFYDSIEERMIDRVDDPKGNRGSDMLLVALGNHRIPGFRPDTTVTDNTAGAILDRIMSIKAVRSPDGTESLEAKLGSPQ